MVTSTNDNFFLFGSMEKQNLWRNLIKFCRAFNSQMSHQKKKSRESSREFSDLNVSLRDDPLTADLRTNLQKCTD